uniref:Uncharacterized protein n=1 Tax=Aegilops tauschii subsp. strangulata TaxID=200361 RepID=A0A452XRY7_AEGTS
MLSSSTGQPHMSTNPTKHKNKHKHKETHQQVTKMAQSQHEDRSLRICSSSFMITGHLTLFSSFTVS